MTHPNKKEKIEKALISIFPNSTLISLTITKDGFQLELDQEINFAQLEKLALLFGTKRINLGSAAGNEGYYGEQSHHTTLYVTEISKEWL